MRPAEAAHAAENQLVAPDELPTVAAPDTDALIALLVRGGLSAAKVQGTLRGRRVVITDQVRDEFLRGPGPRAELLHGLVSSTDAVLGAAAPSELIARYVAGGLKPGDAAVAAQAHEAGAEVITFDTTFARRLRRLGDPVTWLTHDPPPQGAERS